MTILASTPTTTRLASTSFVTTAPAPIVDSSPTGIGPSTTALQPIKTRFQIVGTPSLPHRPANNDVLADVAVLADGGTLVDNHV